MNITHGEHMFTYIFIEIYLPVLIYFSVPFFSVYHLYTHTKDSMS